MADMDLNDLYSQSWLEGPFGNADATRVNLQEFISVDGVMIAPRLNSNAMAERIIVGRKGSGKTLYLRSIKSEAAKRQFISFEQIDDINTEIVLFAHDFARDYISKSYSGAFDFYIDQRSALSSFWKLLWERAILLSVVSLIYAKKSSDGETENHFPNDAVLSRQQFFARFGDIAKQTENPISPSAWLKEMVSDLSTPSMRRMGSDSVHWEDMQRSIVTSLTKIPPVAIYIDALDDYFEEAPEAWFICQAGLFRAIFQFLYSRTEMGNRLHIVATVRDIVFSSILKTEHGNRFITDEHIKMLDWASPHIRYFLSEKIRKISKKPRMPSIEDWIGLESVYVPSRKRSERVTEYILRHTRMIPRDIVIVGNAIASEIFSRKSLQDKTFSEGALRKQIAVVSCSFANESLRLCANELLMSSEEFVEFFRPPAEHEETGLKISSEEIRGELEKLKVDLRQSLIDRMRHMIKGVNKETFTFDQLKESIIEAKLGHEVDFKEGVNTAFRLDNILWRHGLLAYQARAGTSLKWRFNWRGTLEAESLPTGERMYGFHPCIQELFRLEVTSDGPVY